MIDVFIGMVKGSVFGAIITSLGCYYGYYTKGGAEGVGKATTNAVVISSILILISNYLLTALFFNK
jgi:phospholipid/cholesterol/gamma-HCH transport system permease protein